ncbi:MFS transporter [Desulfovibrio sp. OttesenSCG-928-C06]|nr:MFS transporter [Desulfovibrio sp. OttesenSCG-928-C06]
MSGTYSEKLSAPEKRVMVIAVTVTSMIAIGVSSVAPSLPLLGRHFGTDEVTTALLITSFTLPGLLFLPLAGFFADRYGRKAVLLPSLIIFGLSGTACAFTSSFETMLALRAVQGISAAPFGMLGATLIGDTFNGPKLGRMMGVNGSVLNVTLALSPAIGGFLANIHWKAIFILPLIALAAAVFSFRQPLQKPENKPPLKGYFQSVLGLLRNRKVLALLGLGFFNLFITYGPILTCFSLLADSKHQASPAHIGYILGSLSISAAITAPWAGKMLSRTSPHKLLVAGQSCIAVGLAIIPFVGILWLHLVPILLFGAGIGLCSTTVVSTMVAQAPTEQRASLMSAYGMSLCLAQTAAPLICGAITKWFGVDYAFFSMAVAAAIMVALSRNIRWDKQSAATA